MFGLDFNNTIVTTCKRILLYAPGIQSKARKELIDNLQSICSKCEDGYGAVLKRLKPVKAAYGDKKKLSEELLSFASDVETRSAFKPEYLCGEIDHLISKLKNKLNALQYSVNFSSLDMLDRTLKSMGNFDAELYHQYDDFRFELDGVARKLKSSKGKEADEWLKFVEDLIDDVEKKIRRSVKKMRKAKTEILNKAF